MRFRRGSKVEVMNKKEVLTSWCCGEIISGKGHTYSVRYDCYPGTTREVVVERVSRKVIRPRPPPVGVVESWLAGDVVEVFDDNSWKIATILKFYGGDYYLVRLLGLSQEFRVHKLSIRVRQSWQGDKWVFMGKGSGSCRDVKSSKLSTSNCYQKMSFQVPQDTAKIKVQGGPDCLAFRNNEGLQESHIVSLRSLKRASLYCSSLKAHAGNIPKKRAIEKEGGSRQVVPAPLLEKVDAVAYPRENLGEKYMHDSFNNRSNGYNELETGKSNGVVGCSFASISEPNDTDSNASSVASCSINNRSPNKFSSHFVAVACQEIDTFCCEEESFRGSGDEEEGCSLPAEEEVASSIHRLELHAYRCTLEALYPSGPLSWEKEALLTNLRIMLHISHDEHLMELRNLISAGTSILN